MSLSLLVATAPSGPLQVVRKRVVSYPASGGTIICSARALCGDVTWEESLENTLTAPSLKVLSGGQHRGQAASYRRHCGSASLWAESRESIREGNIVDAIEKGSVAFRNMFEAKMQSLISDGMKGEAEAVALSAP